MFGTKRVKDPICGMQVDPKSAISLHIGGTTHYFCSENCAKEFKAGRATEHHSGHSHEDHGCGC